MVKLAGKCCIHNESKLKMTKVYESVDRIEKFEFAHLSLVLESILVHLLLPIEVF